MSMMRLWQVPLCALVLCVAVPLRVSQAADVRAPTSVAKAPPQATPVAAQGTAKAQPTSPRVTSPVRAELVRALAPTVATVGESAADLIDDAQECMWYEDWTQARELLQAAAAIDAASPDAGLALALNAATYAYGSNQTQADPLFDQVRAAYATDSQVLALCDIAQAWAQGKAQGPSAEPEQALAAAAEQWKGTFTGGWAALRLAEHYIHASDADKAIAVCQSVLRDYKTGPIGEEALVLQANAVQWCRSDLPAAIALYQDALQRMQSPRLRLRALVYEADCYAGMLDFASSFRTLQSVDVAYAGRPGLPWARLYRAKAGRWVDRWDVSPEDARAFLATTSEELGNRSTARRILGDALVLQGRFVEAEAEFAAMVGTPEGTWGIEEGYHSIGVCREERGDLAGAVEAYLEAAARATKDSDKAQHLYAAALAANGSSDAATYSQILARMEAECPGSDLTTRLLGREVLPPPEI